MTIAVIAVGCGSNGGGGETTAELPASPTGKAEAVNFDGIHSGEIELALEIDRYKKKPEEINMRILGNFMKAGEEDLPRIDLAIESRGDLAGRNVDFLSGPLLQNDFFVANFAGNTYEPDPATFKELKSKLIDAQMEAGGDGNAMACVEAGDGLALTDLVHHVSFEGKGETLDGTKVETVGADLDLSAATGEVIELGEESPGCKAQLEALGLPGTAQLEALEKELEGSLTAARVTIGLDKQGRPRYFKVLVNVELPRNEELEVELVMRLNKVNEVTELPGPPGSAPFPKLLKRFGLSMEDFKQADGSAIYLGVLEVLSKRLLGLEKGR
jgi:hypothetical protein